MEKRKIPFREEFRDMLKAGVEREGRRGDRTLHTAVRTWCTLEIRDF